MRMHYLIVPVLLAGAAPVVAGGGNLGAHPEPLYTTDFGLECSAGFAPDGGNLYFALDPGRFHRFEGVDEDGAFVEVEHTVLDRVRVIPVEIAGTPVSVVARVVEEREWIDGALAEVTLNYYARCTTSDNIYYFGEDTSLYEDGEVVSHEGSWLAGVDGAQPGLFMPSVFLLGSRYHQELAPGLAMDRAEHLAQGLRVATPAGVFEQCVMITESTPLEEDDETIKVYGPNIGALVDGPLVLVDFHE